MRTPFIVVCLILSVLHLAEPQAAVIKATDFISDNNFTPQECRTSSVSRETPPRSCGRQIIDGRFSLEDIDKLQQIVEKGMAQRTAPGGPTILDVNTGFIRDTNGLENLFDKDNDIYSVEDFAHYGKVISLLRNSVIDVFSLTTPLHFTAPTFFTRIDARTPWEAQEMHDEYWHVHADMNNTEHYHYSGLLYMSNYGEDFTGGRLRFIRDEDSCSEAEAGANLLPPDDSDLIVEPRKGRMAIFSSGAENPHHVEKVVSGQRFVLSFWFTTFEDKKFEIFLDGQSHTTFAHSIRKSFERNRK